MKKTKIKVFAPATVANMACGFDSMGFAIEGVGDVVEVSVSDGDGINIVNISGEDLPIEREKNVMVPPLLAMKKKLNIRCSVDITIINKIRPGSGIGSSAASSGAAVFAFNELLGRPFCKEDLISFAILGEELVSGGAHADNVAPSILGGIVLVRDNNPLDVIKLISPITMYCAVVHPFIEVKTRDSRAVLKKEISLSDAVTQWSNVGAIVAGLLCGDIELIGRSMRDVVAEPVRKVFIPEYDSLKYKVMCAGAIGCNISGSGPSVFALCRNRSDAVKMGDIMRNHFGEMSVGSDVYISAIADKGVREIND